MRPRFGPCPEITMFAPPAMTTMQHGAVSILALVVLAGCAGEPAATSTDGAEETPTTGPPGIFIAHDGGIDPADDLPGLVAEPDKGHYAIDMMQFIQRDLAFVMLIQALADLNMRSEQDSTISVPGIPQPGEGRDSKDFCIFGMQEILVPGEAYLERAQGRTAAIPDPEQGSRSYGWVLWTAPELPITFGFGTGTSLGATLDAGDWMLLAGAQSGIAEADFHVDTNKWAVDIQVDGPVRVIMMPATTFMCGNGFTRSPAAAGSAPFHIGGSLAVQDRYGSTAMFAANTLEQLEPAYVTASNEATLAFRNETIQLDALSNVWRASYDPAQASITNTRWLGAPGWLLTGLSIPHPDEVGLDNGNGTVRILELPK